MSSWSESAWRRRMLALFHLPPGSAREFLSFTFLVVIKKFCTGLASRAASTREVPEGWGLLNRTADPYAA
jgi:hypothetical protein